MNILLALEQLGYQNLVDFEVNFEEGVGLYISKWNHIDPEPDQIALDAAWSAWQSAHAMGLSTIKENAKAAVDAAAESVRTKYITPGAGQAMTYAEKSDEAADFVAANYPSDLSMYPFIQAEVNATGKTASAAADDILARKSAWIAVGAAIEEARLAGKMSIDTAADEAAVVAARDTTIATLETM